MIKRIRLLILSTVIGLVLASCSLTATQPDAEAALLDIQQTATPGVIIELAVQADTSVPFNTVGQVIKFNYSIKAIQNDSANVPANISITGAAAVCPPLNTVGNLDERLDAGETMICMSDYTIAQADLDRGSVSIVVTASAHGASSNPVTATVPTVPAKALSLTKTADPASYDRIGQTITYNYVIKNSGSTTLGPTQFTVSDAGFGAPINCGNADATLASNATVTCSAQYAITAADMNAASVATNATASGGGVGPSQPATATITKAAASQPNLTAGSTIQHRVIDGEWLWQIARCYGADPKATIQANAQLPNPAQISPDTTVNVPNIGSAGKIYGPPCVGTHTVQAGETWNSIALKYNADPAILQMINSNTMAVGSVIKVPLNSASIGGSTTAASSADTCVDLARGVKLAGLNANPTHFNVCGTADASGNMRIKTIKVSQRLEEVPTGALSQDITLPVNIETATPVNDADSLIVGDMNYDGNDDFRVMRNRPGGPNIPYVYFLFDPATRQFVYNEEYGKIRSPEFPGNSEIRSQWRKSASNWGIDTYTIANNIPRLVKREEWTAINETQATHTVTIFNADGTSQVTVNETVPLPAQ